MIEDEPQFKQNLFQTFKDTGMVDNMKAQMRFKLIDKLQKQAPIRQKQDEGEQSQLRKRIIVSLMNEFMDIKQFNYTNSVFLPECGYQNQILSRAEIFEILKFRDIEILHDRDTSLMEKIIDMFLGKIERQAIKTCSSTQTEYGDSIMNLETKLNMIDLQWREKMAKELVPNQQSVEERMSKWKKEYEQRMKADMAAELTRIRQFELSNIRLEEQEKCQLQLSEYREELEKKFQEKLNKLREREVQTLDKCSQKMKDLEQYNHEHRQKIIKDFDYLKLKEEDLEKSKKLNDEKLNVEKLRLETLQKDLKSKIKELDQQRLQSEGKNETDKQMAKLEVYKEVQQEQLEYIQKKKILEEDLLKINILKESLNNFKNQNKSLTEENSDLVGRVQDLTKKKSDLENDLRQIRDNMQTINESYRREQGSSKNMNEKLRMKEDEISFLKGALKEKDEISNQAKQSSQEQIKKFNNEVQGYQYKIEKLETELRNTRKENIENEELIKRGIGTGPYPPVLSLKYPLEESLNVSKMQQSFAQRLTGMQNEHQQVRDERKKTIYQMMQDNNQPTEDIYKKSSEQKQMDKYQSFEDYRPPEPPQEYKQEYRPPQEYKQEYRPSPPKSNQFPQPPVMTYQQDVSSKTLPKQTFLQDPIPYKQDPPRSNTLPKQTSFQSDPLPKYQDISEKKSVQAETPIKAQFPPIPHKLDKVDFTTSYEVPELKKQQNIVEAQDYDEYSQNFDQSSQGQSMQKIKEAPSPPPKQEDPKPRGQMFGQLRSLSNQRKDMSPEPEEFQYKKDSYQPTPKPGKPSALPEITKKEPEKKLETIQKKPFNPLGMKQDDDYSYPKTTFPPQKKEDVFQPKNKYQEEKKIQKEKSESEVFMDESVQDMDFEEIVDEDFLP